MNVHRPALKAPAVLSATWRAVLVVVLGLTILLGGCSDDDPVQNTAEPTWEVVLEPGYTLRAVWGVHASNFFTVGEKGIIRHYDTGQWSSWQFNHTPTLHGVWGTDDSHVLVVGDEGTCYHFDGEQWQSQYAATTADLYSIWGTSWDNVFACGSNGTLVHFNGETWTNLGLNSTCNTDSA